VSKRMCTIEGCTRPAHGRGLCGTHIARIRHGRPLDAPVRSWTRERIPCSVDGCEGRAKARSLCAKHYLRWFHHGDPLTVKPATGGSMPAELHPRWVGDAGGYHTAHNRVVAARGRAGDYDCEDCGSPAAHWSYDHRDLDERWSRLGPYSLKREHYRPRCVSCHKRLDLSFVVRRSRPDGKGKAVAQDDSQAS
jgi:hypothetical protein